MIATDRTASKVAIIAGWADVLGLANIHARKADSSNVLEKDYEQERRQQAKQPGRVGKGGNGPEAKARAFFEEESFDRILLDPPCSALGLRPRLKVRPALCMVAPIDFRAQCLKASFLCFF